MYWRASAGDDDDAKGEESVVVGRESEMLNVVVVEPRTGELADEASNLGDCRPARVVIWRVHRRARRLHNSIRRALGGVLMCRVRAALTTSCPRCSLESQSWTFCQSTVDGCRRRQTTSTRRPQRLAGARAGNPALVLRDAAFCGVVCRRLFVFKSSSIDLCSDCRVSEQVEVAFGHSLVFASLMLAWSDNITPV